MVPMIRTLSLVGFLAASSFQPATAAKPQVPSDQRAAEIDRLLQGYARYRFFSGAVAVAEQGQLVYEQAFGLADREWQIPNAIGTRFSIASVTKPYTAALILRLVDEGLLALETRISDVLDDYRADTGARITVHQLLSHSSGLPNYAGSKEFWEGNPSRLDYDRGEFVRSFCSGDPLFEPGTSGHYSDANYYLLALMAEAVTGRSFSEAMNAFVLQPIAARDSGNIERGCVIERLAHGYFRTGAHHSVPPPINYEHVQLGAGDMYATVGDMLRFEAALRDGSLLSASSADAAFTPHSPSGFAGQSNGYGWNLGHVTLRDSGRRVAIRHAPGNNAGFAAVIYCVTAEERVIALVQNTGPGYLDMRVYTLCEEILHILCGERPRIPPTGVVGRRRTRGSNGGRRGCDCRVRSLLRAPGSGSGRQRHEPTRLPAPRRRPERGRADGLRAQRPFRSAEMECPRQPGRSLSGCR